MVGLRTFPSFEKPSVGSGGPDGTTVLGGSTVGDEGELEFWASAVPRRVNKQHRAEKEDARNIFE